MSERLPVVCSLDLEAEMGRFEQNLDNEKQKYSMLEMPSAAPERQATLALDCLATCGLGALLSTSLSCSCNMLALYLVLPSDSVLNANLSSCDSEPRTCRRTDAVR